MESSGESGDGLTVWPIREWPHPILDVVDLGLSCFEQRLNHEYLWHLWESSQLVGGHS